MNTLTIHSVEDLQNFIEYQGGALSIRAAARLCQVSDVALGKTLKGDNWLTLKLSTLNSDLNNICNDGLSLEETREVIYYYAFISKRSKNSAKLLAIRLGMVQNIEDVKIKIKTKKAQYVYFIYSEDVGCVKIGVSNNPKKRVKGLQTGFPYKLTLFKIKAFKDARGAERALHGLFADDRLEGEWFNSVILDDIDTILNNFKY